jgi:hypothetical protein
LCASAVVDDLETSWNRKKEKTHRFLSYESEEKKISLSVRNRVAWERAVWVRNRFLYRINMLVYLLGLATHGVIRRLSLRHTIHRLKLVYKAIRLGENMSLRRYE